MNYSLKPYQLVVFDWEGTLGDSLGVLMPGVIPLLQRLHDHGILLGIASNKGIHSLRQVLIQTRLADYFPVVRSASQTAPKPCPQMLIEIMGAYHVDPSDTLMVGDSVTDMQMAVALGVDVVGVDFYHEQEAFLRAAGAMHVYDDYEVFAKRLIHDE